MLVLLNNLGNILCTNLKIHWQYIFNNRLKSFHQFPITGNSEKGSNVCKFSLPTHSPNVITGTVNRTVILVFNFLIKYYWSYLLYGLHKIWPPYSKFCCAALSWQDVFLGGISKEHCQCMPRVYFPFVPDTWPSHYSVSCSHSIKVTE